MELLIIWFILFLFLGYKGYNIAHLEMVNVVVALKVLGQFWANKRIKIHCDNKAVVDILSHGRARDALMATCAHNVWLLTALYNISLLVVHIEGQKKSIADLLSRWTYSEDNVKTLLPFIPHPIWMNTHIEICSTVLYISVPGVATASLANRAVARLWQGFRPYTLIAYRRMIELFLAFLVALDLSLPQVSTLDVLAFTEYLLEFGMSAANITNHLTAIRSMLIIYNCDASAFRDERIPLFIKSVKINRPLQPVFKTVIDEDILLSLVIACDQFAQQIVFKALYLFTYFSFLRFSHTH